jgi:hypothetical protein
MMSLGSDGSTDVAAVGLEVLVAKVLRLAEGIHVTRKSNGAKSQCMFFFFKLGASQPSFKIEYFEMFEVDAKDSKDGKMHDAQAIAVAMKRAINGRACGVLYPEQLTSISTDGENKMVGKK